MAEGAPQRGGRTLKVTGTDGAKPSEGAQLTPAPPPKHLVVGKISAPLSPQQRRQQAEEAAKRREHLMQAAGQDEPGRSVTEPWRRIGGEEFDRRAQLKDSFGSIWSREQGLAADQAKGSKKAHSGSFVYTWGMGYHGQLGRKFSRGEIRMCLQPNPVSLPAGVSACQVACGAFHTMVLTLDGRVFSWGEGRHGQLGYSCLAKQETPMEVTDIQRGCGSYIACGRHHSAMIDRIGGLWTWGHGKQGQLGDGERPTARHKPHQVTMQTVRHHDGSRSVEEMPVGFGFKQLACGARHTAAVSFDGELYTFGSGKQGQLGHGILEDELYPMAVKEFTDAIRSKRARLVDASATLTAVVTEDDGLFCWGMADSIHAHKPEPEQVPPEFGNARPPPASAHDMAAELAKCQSRPARLCPKNLKIRQAQVGQGHILILTKEGDLYSWGQGSDGEIGTGAKVDVHKPRLVMTGKGVQDICVGRYHNAVLTAYGLLYTWGAGEHGQLGHGEETTQLLPRLAEELLDCVTGQVACGEQHTAVLTSAKGMQTMQGTTQWRGQEQAELRIKEQMAVSLPLGIGARELHSIGPSVRTFVDLFEEEVKEEGQVDDPASPVKEIQVETRAHIMEETQQRLQQIVDLKDADSAGSPPTFDDLPLAESSADESPFPSPTSSPRAGDGSLPASPTGDDSEPSSPTNPIGSLHDQPGTFNVNAAGARLMHVKQFKAQIKSKKQQAAEKLAAEKKAQVEEKEREKHKLNMLLAAWAKTLFKNYDADLDGTLTYKELLSGAQQPHLKRLPAGLKFLSGDELIEAMDRDRSGSVTLFEFTDEITRVCGTLEEAKKIGINLKPPSSARGRKHTGMARHKSEDREHGRGRTPTGSPTKKVVIKPTPPDRIKDPKLRAADEKLLMAFFKEFQPDFATIGKVKQVIKFYSEEHGRRARISPMSSTTAGDYRDTLRAAYKLQRGVDPWEWWAELQAVEQASKEEEAPKPAAPETPKFMMANTAHKEGRKSARAAARAQNAARAAEMMEELRGDSATPTSSLHDQPRSRKPAMQMAEAKAALKNLSNRAAEGRRRPQSARAEMMRPRSARSTGTVRPPSASRGDGEARPASARSAGSRRPRSRAAAHKSPRRTPGHSHVSAADRAIFRGFQGLRAKERHATDHWMTLFSPLGPRSELVRQAGEVLMESRQGVAKGRGAQSREAAQVASRVSVLRTSLDRSKTVLTSKKAKLDDLKCLHSTLSQALEQETASLADEKEEESRAKKLLETVHTRVMEAQENHIELESTMTYMKEHMLNMQLMQKERTDELEAARRLHSSLLRLQKRGEMMAQGVLSQVIELREDEEAVRQQFRDAMLNYHGVRVRSAKCVEEVQAIQVRRQKDREAERKKQAEQKQKKLGRSAASGIMQSAKQRALFNRAVKLEVLFDQLKEQVGFINIDNPADIEKIIDKYKQQVADSSHHDEKLANSAMIEDRQLATRRVEMLESERDGLEEMLRDAMERSTGIDTGEVYTISPITYQLLFRDEELLEETENETEFAELLSAGGTADGFAFNAETMVWSDKLGPHHVASTNRNGWMSWVTFRDMKTNGKLQHIGSLRVAHPSRIRLKRSDAENKIRMKLLHLEGDMELKREHLLEEVHINLDVMTMMRPMGIKSSLWIEVDPTPRNPDERPLYELVFGIGQRLGIQGWIPYTELPANAKTGDNDHQVCLLKMVKAALLQCKLPALPEFPLQSSEDDDAPSSMRDAVCLICHHLELRTGFPEHEEVESVAGDAWPYAWESADGAASPRVRADRSSSAAALLSLDPSISDVPATTKGNAQWELAPDQMEPLIALEQLEGTLSRLVESIARADTLREALGPDNAYRLDGLLGQSAEEMEAAKRTHQSMAVTKESLRAFCLGEAEAAEAVRPELPLALTLKWLAQCLRAWPGGGGETPVPREVRGGGRTDCGGARHTQGGASAQRRIDRSAHDVDPAVRFARRTWRGMCRRQTSTTCWRRWSGRARTKPRSRHTSSLTSANPAEYRPCQPKTGRRL